MSSNIPPQSPAGLRNASTPNGTLVTPTTAAVVNGVGGGNTTVAATTTSVPQAPLTQQNLNQIVIDYLNKKGYSKAEQVLRAESSGAVIPEGLLKPKETGPPQYSAAFTKYETWCKDVLDIYRPEVQRLLWPLFIYFFLTLSDQLYTREARSFWNKHQEQFRTNHESDLRQFEHILLPEHQKEDNIAKIYKDNKYRINITTAGFQYLMQFLESLPNNWYKLILNTIESHLDIRQVTRANDESYSFEAIIRRGQDSSEIVEDEGIPGHKPGNAISSEDPSVGNNLATLRLGKLPMEKELEEDVRGDLGDLDLAVPPSLDQPTLVSTHEQINIKQEDDDDGPNRLDIPYPPSSSRDVAIEVQKIRENRDRLKIEGRTGGIGPGLSCVMYTFHNTADNVTCMDFSGDQSLVAVGTNMSYIRIWSMTGEQIGHDDAGVPVNSKRLIGHSGPVFDLTFAPSSTQPPNATDDTAPMWLLSCSVDSTIRLWSLKAWQCVVSYKGHVGPVTSVKFCPMAAGNYFISGGMDKTARLWSTSKASCRRLFVGHDDDVSVVAWHPNTAYMFTASDDKTIRMFSISNGQPVRMFTGHTDVITALACSRDGKILASADVSGTILLWDLTPGRLLKTFRGHGRGGIWCLSWGVESTVLVSGGADNTVRVWDVNLPGKESATGKAGEGVKTDGGVVGAVGGGMKKRGKGPAVSADQISAWPTKKTPVKYVGVTNMNLIVAGGCYLPENYPN